MSDYEGWRRRFAWWPLRLEHGGVAWLEWVATVTVNFADPVDPDGIELVVFARRWNDHVKEMMS